MRLARVLFLTLFTLICNYYTFPVVTHAQNARGSGFTTTFSVGSSTYVAVTANTAAKTITVGEDPSVASYPTTGFFVAKPGSANTPREIASGAVYSFSAEGSFQPGDIAGYIKTVSGTTTFFQDESASPYIARSPGGGAAGGSPAAPSQATYVLETANAALPNAVALSPLATGPLAVTTTTGVPRAGTAGDINGVLQCTDAVGTDSYACNLSPAILAYSTNACYSFKAGTANTGAASIAFNGLAALTIKKYHDQDLETGDIESGQIVTVCYDGTNAQMQSQIANTTGTGAEVRATNPTFTNPLSQANGGTNCAAPYPILPETSTYQVVATDFTCRTIITVASGTFTITLVASGTQPVAGTWITVVNYGSGVVTIARSGQNINGGTSSLTIPAASATTPMAAFVTSDGTNYFASLSMPTTLTGTASQITVSTANGNITLSIPSNAVLPGTATTINGSLGQGYTIQYACVATLAPADSTTYFCGLQAGGAATVTNAIRRLYIPKAGTIKAVQASWLNAGTLGTSETSTVSVRLNDTTDTAISAVVTNAASWTQFANSAMSVAVAVGDYIEIKWATPAWATNPTNVGMSGTVYIE